MTISRAALYARVSTDDQTTDNQLPELRDYATRRGWEIVSEHSDTISGSKTNRPALDQMMKLVEKGKVDVVLVWKFDRLTRSLRDLLAFVDEFRDAQVALVSVRDSFDTSTPIGRACLSMVGTFAEFERECIRERVKAGMDRARKHGTKSGRPIGGRPVVVDLKTLKALWDIGYSTREISRRLKVSQSKVMREVAKIEAEKRAKREAKQA